jgi:UDP-N-acetyl-D-glucosamine dehydrogenase
MNILREKGAEIDYYDPFIPVIEKHAGPHWEGRHSIEWNPETLSQYTAAVVCTAHKGVDYTVLAEQIPLIVDACNIVPKNGKAHVIPA